MISPSAVLLQRGRCPQLVCGFLAASILLTTGLPGLLQSPVLSQSFNTPALLTQTTPTAFQRTSGQNSPQASPSQDPLNSAYPVPWDAIWKSQAQATQSGKMVAVQHLSKTLTSPDGQRQAHSEINIHLDPVITQSHISSSLIITDAQGVVLQQIPSSMHLGSSVAQESTAAQLGTLSMLMPAAWSKDGQQLLTRQFEAVFGSDVSSDYALIWNRNTQQAKTIAPTPSNYDTATLLGWSDRHPDQVLFRTAILGEQDTALFAVAHDGKTVALKRENPLDPRTAPTGTQARR
jgi:hypothetical protein